MRRAGNGALFPCARPHDETGRKAGPGVALPLMSHAGSPPVHGVNNMHALDFTTGRAALAFTGERSAIWHGLGQSIDPAASLEEWRTAAGMDWRIQRAFVRYAPAPDAAPVAWTDHHVLIRSDNKAPLSIVSDSFEIVQPAQVLEFFRDLIRDAGFTLTTAGCLHGGRKFWAQADVGAGDDVVPGDFVGARLLLATACDGSMATVAKGVSERVVCANTLGFAMAEKGGSLVKVSHRSVFDASRVKNQLGLASSGFARFIRGARELARQPVSPQEADAFILSLMGGRPDDDERNDKVRQSTGFRTIAALFDGKGRGMTPTLWGLVNATTEYVDHYQRARSADNRFDSSQFGAGDDLKTAALEKALELV
jgi:phage/plasmid-like protein (TIGR03299 family)